MKAFINRNIEKTIRDAANYLKVICVTGPRQSGKSTLIKNMFSDFEYYSMEDLGLRQYAMSDPIGFLSSHSKKMIIDEIQQTPELLSYIQGIVDNDNEQRFIISGSSNFLLLKSVSQSLAGRVGVFELLPMALSEVADIRKSKSLDELLFDGLYPSICAGDNVAKYFYPSYVKTYLEKDIRTLVNVKDLMQFNTFLRLCAGRIGSVFNASELASEVGVSSKTITSWVSALEASYIIYLLPPWFENTRKRLTKSPKLYFVDTGLACYLLGIESTRQLATDKMRGHLFENLVVSEALKHNYNLGKTSNAYFYRDSNGNEIDLLLRKEGRLNLYEIKSAQTFSDSFTKVLKNSSSLINTPIDKKCIIYTGEFEQNGGDINLLNLSSLDSVFM